jgi:AcrR family transcriptional regulator
MIGLGSIFAIVDEYSISPYTCQVVEQPRAKRAYNSQRRRQQAESTRLSILEAAQRLFERDGYVATTVDDIAVEAGVALKTVYSAFTTKAGLLRAVWDLLLKGDADEAPVAARAWYRSVLVEPRGDRQLRLLAAGACSVKIRIGGLLKVIRSASAIDLDSAALWQLIQSDFYENQRAIVSTLDARGALRSGLGATEATDILWTLNHPDVWLLLVGERGWTPEAFEAWFADTVCQQLLGKTARGRK